MFQCKTEISAVELDHFGNGQGVVTVSNSKHKTEAQQSLDFIKTDEVQQVLKRYGFTLL